MQIGKILFRSLINSTDIVGSTVKDFALRFDSQGIYAASINPNLADTSSFCEQYRVERNIATNCIIMELKRADRTWYAACLILADDMLDINGKVRRHMNARKASFAPKDVALNLTNMEYGGITPIGLPANWDILIDRNFTSNDGVVVGGGNRSSKLLLTKQALENLPNVAILDIIKQ